MEEYNPTPDDIAWAAIVLELVKNGGVIGFPTTKLFYRVNHIEKTLTLTNPEELSDPVDGERNTEVHRRTIATFGKLGVLVLVDEK